MGKWFMQIDWTEKFSGFVTYSSKNALQAIYRPDKRSSTCSQARIEWSLSILFIRRKEKNFKTQLNSFNLITLKAQHEKYLFSINYAI